MTSSSLSTLAAYLGGSHQTVYYMPYIPYMEHSVCVHTTTGHNFVSIL